METPENENFNSNILIESKLLEQEHRPTHLVLNYLNRKKKYPNEDDPRRKAVQRAIIWRLFFSPTMLAVGGSTLLGIITAFILYNQTEIINDQTKIFKEQTNIINEQKFLLEDQNKKIEIQAHLEDANRRNNLVFLMDNVLNRIDDELKLKKNKDSSLSKPLLARIQALGQGFQPYKYIDYTLKDSLNRDSLGLTKLLSPERGQLLLSLANSGIGRKTMSLICKNTSFKKAGLKSAHLSHTYLVFANLEEANLRGADLRGADLRGAILFGANLKSTNLTDADLTDADLIRANLEDADLTNANLILANLRDADLRSTILKGAILRGAILRGAILARVNLTGVHLRGADLRYADLRGAILTFSDLRGAILIGANLSGADLRGADLRNADLWNIKSIDSCRVGRKDWLIYIRDSLKLRGAATLAKEYKTEEYKPDGNRFERYKFEGYILLKK